MMQILTIYDYMLYHLLVHVVVLTMYNYGVYRAPIFWQGTMVKLRGTWLQIGRAEWAAKRRVRFR